MPALTLEPGEIRAIREMFSLSQLATAAFFGFQTAESVVKWEEGSQRPHTTVQQVLRALRDIDGGDSGVKEEVRRLINNNIASGDGVRGFILDLVLLGCPKTPEEL